MFDFSTLKNINFLNLENLIFLAVFLIVVIFLLLICFLIVKFSIKLIIGIFKKIFYKDNFSKDQGSNLEVVVSELEKSKEERNKIGKEKVENNNTPHPKIDYVNYSKNSDDSEKKKDNKQVYEEKEQKSVEEGLSKLKSSGSDDKDTLESRMPLRSENQEGIDSHEKIKIPRAKIIGGDSVKNSGVDQKKSEAKYLNEPVVKSSDLHGQSLVYEKEKIFAAKKTLHGGSEVLEDPVVKSSDLHERSLAYGGEKINNKKGGALNRKTTGYSIFGDRPEVSREKLKQEMRSDTTIWQAASREGLNFSPIERVKLVEKVFSSSLGRNISKSDLKLSIEKLNEKMSVTKDPKVHATIRKEIKFFEKIGGIK